VTDFYSASLSADGTKVLAVRAGKNEVVVQEVDRRSGKAIYSVPIGPASALNTPYYCGVLWASPAGIDMITQCGRQQELVVNGHPRPDQAGPDHPGLAGGFRDHVLVVAAAPQLKN
jgi:hypothetical protein